MKTRITELFNIEYPCFQGGMAWISNASLAAAVSNGGGVGLIAAGSAPADVIRKEIRLAKEKTNKPFGVNIMLMSPYAADIAELVYDEKVPVVTTGAGNPGKYVEKWKEAGIRIVPVVASVSQAVRMERYGADAVVAEGCESGGHIGELTTMTLVPQVVDAVQIPVLAAGGIADGRGIAAAFMLGAEGVQIGTRFLLAEECTVHENYKQMVEKATDISTIVTGRAGGHPSRCLKNSMTRNILAKEKQNEDPDKLEELLNGTLRMAAVEGDAKGGSVMAGQIAGLVSGRKPAADIIKDIFTQAERLLYK